MALNVERSAANILDSIRSLAIVIDSAGRTVENLTSISEKAKKPAYDMMHNADYAFVQYAATNKPEHFETIMALIDKVNAFVDKHE